MTMDTHLLEDIGLTKSESKVYLALLEIGSCTTGKIVDKSKASSSKIYEILDKLMQKGLVSFIIKNGMKFYEAAPSDRIMDYMHEKEEAIQKQKNQLKNLLPELELKRQMSKYESEATIFKGIKGIETAFFASLDLLNEGDEILITSVSLRSEILKRVFIKIGKERVKRKITARALFNEPVKGEIQLKNPLTTIRYVPINTPTGIYIYKNRVLIMPQSDDYLLIVIDNKEIADSFRAQFELQWNQKAKLTKGFASLRRELELYVDEVEKNKESYLVMGAGFGANKDAYIKFFKEFSKYRIKKKLPAKLLFQQGMGDFLTSYQNPDDMAENRFLSYQTKMPVSIIPSTNKTLLLIEDKEPTTITIENKYIGKAFIDYFNSMWNQQTMVFEGVEAVKNLFRESVNFGDYVVFAEGKRVYQALGNKFYQWWQKEKTNRKIKSRGIMNKKYLKVC